MPTYNVGTGILKAMSDAGDEPAGDERGLVVGADGAWLISTAPGQRAAYTYYADSNQVYMQAAAGKA